MKLMPFHCGFYPVSRRMDDSFIVLYLVTFLSCISIAKCPEDMIQMVLRNPLSSHCSSIRRWHPTLEVHSSVPQPRLSWD